MKYFWLIIASFIGSLQGRAAEKNEGYQVHEVGKTLEILTPTGKKIFYSNVGFDTSKDYRIVVPLEALQEEGKASPAVPPPTVPPTPPVAAVAPPPATTTPEPAPPSIEADNEDRGPDSLEDLEAAISEEEVKTPPSKLPVADYDDSDRLIVEANHFFNRGKFYEATLCVEELIRKKPELVRAWIMKGSLLHVQGYRDLARGAWEKAMALDPKNPQIKDYLERYK